jgi:hypothetical protein
MIKIIRDTTAAFLCGDFNMSEKIHVKLNNANANRPNNPLRIIYILIFLFIMSFVIWRIFFYKSPEEQLAAIEASLAIPDSENAAVYYNALCIELNFLMTLGELRRHAQSSYYLPWTRNSNPEGYATLRDSNRWIEKIIDISKIKEARFSIYSHDIISIDETSMYIRDIAYILSWAGAYDLGNGRIDSALDKFISQIRISFHLNQQPLRTPKLVGTAIEAVGLRNIRNITMCADITEEQLLYFGYF